VGEKDARYPDEVLFGTADRVICDVPCSGLGVLAKKPDLRYKNEDGVDALPELQYEILSASARYLKVGGRLMYSTCTLLNEENAEVFDRFLREHEDYIPVDFKIGGEVSEGGKFTFVPNIHRTDGFFVGIIERKK
jgi:16S rRNA (cytosine967-C5)-methyltransferase